MGYTTIGFETRGSVALITLQRPDALNALTAQMIEELLDALLDIRENQSVRAVMITGSGKAFCAGQDVGVLAEGDTDGLERLVVAQYPELIVNIQKLEKPVIGAINGAAVGSGFSLALACDMRIAAENASMGPGFTRIGAGPDSGCVYFLPRYVGWARAAELIFTGAIIPAAEAEKIGLVNRVVPQAELMTEAMSLADRLAAGPTRALAAAKRVLRETFTMSLEEALAAEADAQTEVIRTEDFRRGVSAFLEKRQPEFVGR